MKLLLCFVILFLLSRMARTSSLFLSDADLYDIFESKGRSKWKKNKQLEQSNPTSNLRHGRSRPFMRHRPESQHQLELDNVWPSENSDSIQSLDDPAANRNGIQRRLQTDSYEPLSSDYRKNYGSEEKGYPVQPQPVYYLPEHSDKGKYDYGFLALLMVKVLLVAILLPLGFAIFYFLANSFFQQLQQNASNNSSTITVIVNNNCTSNSTSLLINLAKTARHLDLGCKTLNSTTLNGLISSMLLKPFNFGIYSPADSSILTKAFYNLFTPLLNKLCMG